MQSPGKQGSGSGQRRPAAFTLIELLVVITIIAVLGGLVLPGVTRSLSSGKAAGCGSNARQIALAMIAFDNDYQYLPWYNEGTYRGQFDSMGTQTNSQFSGTNWVQKLDYFKYIPRADNASPWLRGVWRCPAASYAEIMGKDANGNPANCPCYAVCCNIFRQQNTLSGNNNVAQRPLKLSRIARPDSIWMVGDGGAPMSKSEPGSGRYLRPGYTFWRPSSKGQWDFAAAYPPSQPALRHNGSARYATFDGHVTQLDWTIMQGESNDFTARADSGTF
jgi:prepilin-type N-terminal cleavage/methylation domain-containing protein/prepilin-type processing-associated H-X9-DG protein